MNNNVREVVQQSGKHLPKRGLSFIYGDYFTMETLADVAEANSGPSANLVKIHG
jgi:hypothetical protein